MESPTNRASVKVCKQFTLTAQKLKSCNANELIQDEETRRTNIGGSIFAIFMDAASTNDILHTLGNKMYEQTRDTNLLNL